MTKKTTSHGAANETQVPWDTRKAGGNEQGQAKKGK